MSVLSCVVLGIYLVMRNCHWIITIINLIKDVYNEDNARM